MRQMELKKHNLVELVGFLDYDDILAITDQQQAAAYVISPRLFAKFIESVETLEDIADMRSAISDYHKGDFIDGEEAFARLGF